MTKKDEQNIVTGKIRPCKFNGNYLIGALQMRQPKIQRTTVLNVRQSVCARIINSDDCFSFVDFIHELLLIIIRLFIQTGACLTLAAHET